MFLLSLSLNGHSLISLAVFMQNFSNNSIASITRSVWFTSDLRGPRVLWAICHTCYLRSEEVKYWRNISVQSRKEGLELS